MHTMQIINADDDLAYENVSYVSTKDLIRFLNFSMW